MESENKKDITLDIQQIMKEWENKEKMYIELPKDKLVDRLILCEMELASEKAEPVNMMELWYFVSDETGVKYLSDKRPEECGTPDSGAKVYLTDGEVNIRVPRSLERLFPGLEYGDAPLRVRMSVSF